MGRSTDIKFEMFKFHSSITLFSVLTLSSSAPPPAREAAGIFLITL